MIKCSVIVANYNNGKYLCNLIDSILRQSYKNWELIIIDDASDEQTKNVIDEYLYDSRIKFYENLKNFGAAYTFKKCIEKSEGDLIAMLGADDALLPNAIYEIVKAHEANPDASMIVGNLICCDEKLNSLNKVLKFKEVSNNDTLLNYFGLCGWDTFKRSYYDKTSGIDINQKRALDQDLYYKLEEVGRVISLDKNLYLYRTNPDGISQLQNKWYAHQYNYLAMINAYNRRTNINFKRNISKKSNLNNIKNYVFLKTINELRQNDHINSLNIYNDILKNLLLNYTVESITKMLILLELISKEVDEKDRKLFTKKILEIYFSDPVKFSLTIHEMFIFKVHKFLSFEQIFKILVKTLLNKSKKVKIC